MGSATHILRYVLAAIVVILLGGLAGWYMFVHKQVAATQAIDAARGFGTAASFGSSAGSNYANTSGSPAAMTSSVQTSSAGNPAPRLWRVTAAPVAGSGFAASSTRVYFAERSSGNILIADPSDSSVSRITNTLFPKIYEAFFAADGSVMLRSVTDTGTVTTFAGTVGTTTAGGPSELRGTYLPQNIVAMSVRSPKQVLFLVNAPGGGVAGATAAWNGSSQKPVFVSALSNWRVWWLADGRMLLAQKPSDDVTGYAFVLKGGALQDLLNAPGLSILPRSGSTALLYSTSAGGETGLFTQTSASTSPIRLALRTVADKCVWAPGTALIAYCAVPQTAPARAGYLQSWYRGALHTSDAWWKIDVSAGTAQILYTPGATVSIDVENPVVDTTGAYISFMNAADKSLWMLRITP